MVFQRGVPLHNHPTPVRQRKRHSQHAGCIHLPHWAECQGHPWAWSWCELSPYPVDITPFLSKTVLNFITEDSLCNISGLSASYFHSQCTKNICLPFVSKTVLDFLTEDSLCDINSWITRCLKSQCTTALLSNKLEGKENRQKTLMAWNENLLKPLQHSTTLNRKIVQAFTLSQKVWLQTVGWRFSSLAKALKCWKTHGETGRQDVQADRWMDITDRQRGRQTDRQTGRLANRDMKRMDWAPMKKAPMNTEALSKMLVHTSSKCMQSAWLPKECR